MLAKASGGDFRLGELTHLPVDDAAVDLVVCGLALTHAADLGPVLAEFARVLRPGGHVRRCSSGSFDCPECEIASIVAFSAR
ncbi:methyltransferase domain-containing protein [Amycolatopsis sp. NPDC051758]|uniref:methyltransferase domain-containing protein n=1 Tax=Amycolatopsis sp. NPDC051758 TaxID=3363935 RepID=UPI00379CFA39